MRLMIWSACPRLNSVFSCQCSLSRSRCLPACWSIGLDQFLHLSQKALTPFLGIFLPTLLAHGDAKLVHFAEEGLRALQHPVLQACLAFTGIVDQCAGGDAGEGTEQRALGFPVGHFVADVGSGYRPIERWSPHR